MARRCCWRWTDDRCEVCGSGSEVSESLRLIYGLNLINEMPVFGLGIIFSRRAFLFLLGPFIVGFGLMQD